jgi:hypothetical protein
MKQLPVQDLRSNLATWAVPPCLVPAVTRAMLDALPLEAFDPGFRGQELETTYFDTAGFLLRKARNRKSKYLTLRVRCYRSEGNADTYALSAKTEDQKFRAVLDPASAALLLDGGPINGRIATFLPADLLARLLGLIGDEPLVPVVTVCARRYAVEDDIDRLTLDLDTHTDTGKCQPTGVLEFKSTLPGSQVWASLAALGLRPIKISKFLWSTLWR